MHDDDRIKWRLERIKRGISLTEISQHIDRSVSLLCAHENGRGKLAYEQWKRYTNYIVTHDNRKN